MADISRKDFNLAAIRIFCDMIVADGYVVKEELVALAEIARGYRLSKLEVNTMKRKGTSKTNEEAIHIFEASRVLENLETKLIQASYEMSFAKAILTIRDWGKKHKEDVDNFVAHLANLSQVDGECSPNEARIQLAVWYVLEKDAAVCSISKDYKFSKKELVYIENDIRNDAIVKSIKDKHWENEKSDIWLGFVDYKKAHGKEYSDDMLFRFFLEEYYQRINQEIQADFLHLQRELRLMDFDLVYIPQTISNLCKFGDGPELLLPALQILNPTKLYGKDYCRITQALKDISTHGFTNALMHECHEHVADATPSLLVKIKSSKKVMPPLEKDGEHTIQRQSDFLIVKIENGSVKNTIAHFLSTYLSFTKSVTHMVTEFIDTKVNTHGFDHTLLDYAINRAYGKEVVEKIIFDFRQLRVRFLFENEEEIFMKLPAYAFSFYLLVMMKPIIQLPLTDVEFQMPATKNYGEDATAYYKRQKNVVKNREKYAIHYRLHEECNAIYRKISRRRSHDISLYKTLNKSMNKINEELEELVALPNRDAYWPELKYGKYDVDRNNIDAKIIYVKEETKENLYNFDEWWRNNIIGKTD